MQPKKIFMWVLRLIAAYILLQTLGHKFGGSEESKYIFTTVGMEPWGRYGSGIVEFIASILLIVPRTVAFGALLAIGTMSGAIFFHLTKLGIEVMSDGGQLFYMAVIVWIACAILLWIYKSQITERIFKRNK
ncbi:MAG: DoxX family protein [Chitinophagales bacterium]|nr:DoxX family protein [Chitinophagales bacterium]